MSQPPVLDQCPYCAGDLASIQAALLLNEDAVPQKASPDHSKAELLARIRQLEHSLQMLDEFCHRTSHDLKEPVRKIVSFGDLLEYEMGGDLSGEAADFLQSMKRAASRLGRLIDRLVEYGRASRFEPADEEVNLTRLAEELRNDFREEIRQTGAYLSLGYLPVIRGDQQRIRRILQEFAANAFQFYDPRRSTLMLEIWAVLGRDLTEFTADPGFMGSDMSPADPERARWCRVCVRDNGRGFPETERENIFRPYIKLGQHQEDERPGLGLAICERIAEQLGGQVSAVGHPDKGATFFLTLPINRLVDQPSEYWNPTTQTQASD